MLSLLGTLLCLTIVGGFLRRGVRVGHRVRVPVPVPVKVVGKQSRYSPFFAPNRLNSVSDPNIVQEIVENQLVCNVPEYCDLADLKKCILQFVHAWAEDSTSTGSAIRCERTSTGASFSFPRVPRSSMTIGVAEENVQDSDGTGRTEVSLKYNVTVCGSTEQESMAVRFATQNLIETLIRDVNTVLNRPMKFPSKDWDYRKILNPTSYEDENKDDFTMPSQQSVAEMWQDADEDDEDVAQGEDDSLHGGVNQDLASGGDSYRTRDSDENHAKTVLHSPRNVIASHDDNDHENDEEVILDADFSSSFEEPSSPSRRDNLTQKSVAKVAQAAAPAVETSPLEEAFLAKPIYTWQKTSANSDSVVTFVHTWAAKFAGRGVGIEAETSARGVRMLFGISTQFKMLIEVVADDTMIAETGNRAISVTSRLAKDDSGGMGESTAGEINAPSELEMITKVSGNLIKSLVKDLQTLRMGKAEGPSGQASTGQKELPISTVAHSDAVRDAEEIDAVGAADDEEQYTPLPRAPVSGPGIGTVEALNLADVSNDVVSTEHTDAGYDTKSADTQTMLKSDEALDAEISDSIAALDEATLAARVNLQAKRAKTASSKLQTRVESAEKRQKEALDSIRFGGKAVQKSTSEDDLDSASDEPDGPDGATTGRTQRLYDPDLVSKARKFGVKLEEYEDRGIEEQAFEELNKIVENTKKQGFFDVVSGIESVPVYDEDTSAKGRGGSVLFKDDSEDASARDLNEIYMNTVQADNDSDGAGSPLMREEAGPAQSSQPLAETTSISLEDLFARGSELSQTMGDKLNERFVDEFSQTVSHDADPADELDPESWQAIVAKGNKDSNENLDKPVATFEVDLASAGLEKGIDLFEGPPDFTAGPDGEAYVDPSSLLGQKRAQDKYKKAPNPRTEALDQVRLDTLVAEIRDGDPLLYDLIFDSYKELLLSDNLLYLLHKAKDEVDRTDMRSSMSQALDRSSASMWEDTGPLRTAYAEITKRAVAIVTELGALARAESMRHLETIHAVCDIAREYQQNDVQFLTMMDTVKPRFDTEFLSYLKFAVADEMLSIENKGRDPATQPSSWLQVLRIVQQGVMAEFDVRFGRLLEPLLLIIRFDSTAMREQLLKQIVNVTAPEDLGYLRSLALNMAEGYLDKQDSVQGEFDFTYDPEDTARYDTIEVSDLNKDMYQFSNLTRNRDEGVDYFVKNREYLEDPGLIVKLAQLRRDINTYLSEDVIIERMNEFEEQVNAQGQDLLVRSRSSLVYGDEIDNFAKYNMEDGEGEGEGEGEDGGALGGLEELPSTGRSSADADADAGVDAEIIGQSLIDKARSRKTRNSDDADANAN